MALNCDCPVPTVIANITTDLNPCPANFGQVQKVLFWRTGNSTTSASAILEATWTALLTATGDTKVVVSPFLSAPTSEGGEPIEFGSGNEVRDGNPIILGAESTTFQAMMYGEEQSVIELFKELQCEGLEVLYVNSRGQIGASVVGTAVTGFPLTSLFVGDKKLGGFDAVDTNEIKWRHKQDWSDDWATLANVANFSALTLINS